MPREHTGPHYLQIQCLVTLRESYALVDYYAWFPPFRCRSAVGGQPIIPMYTERRFQHFRSHVQRQR